MQCSKGLKRIEPEILVQPLAAACLVLDGTHATNTISLHDP